MEFCLRSIRIVVVFDEFVGGRGESLDLHSDRAAVWALVGLRWVGLALPYPTYGGFVLRMKDTTLACLLKQSNRRPV